VMASIKKKKIGRFVGDRWIITEKGEKVVGKGIATKTHQMKHLSRASPSNIFLTTTKDSEG